VTDDTLFDSQNAAYAQAMFEEYARNPESVSAEWRRLFENGAAIAIAEGLLVPDQLSVGHRPASQLPGPNGGAPVASAPAAATHPPAPPAPPAAPPLPTASTVTASSTAVAEAVAHAVSDAAALADAAATEAAARLTALLPAVSRATALVQSFREHGHKLSRIDPLVMRSSIIG